MESGKLFIRILIDPGLDSGVLTISHLVFDGVFVNDLKALRMVLERTEGKHSKITLIHKL